MKTEKQQKAIAEACGWTGICYPPNEWDQYGHPPGKDHTVWRRVPDYLNDLNAMHEAEEVLDMSQLNDYIVELDKYPQHGRFATAAQRADAFLRAVGRWED